MLFMDIEYKSGILFVRLDGKLTKKNAFKLTNYIAPCITKHRIKYLVYNLFKLREIDSSGLDAITITKIAIKENLGKTYICHVPKNIEYKIKKLRAVQLSSEEEILESI